MEGNFLMSDDDDDGDGDQGAGLGQVLPPARPSVHHPLISLDRSHRQKILFYTAVVFGQCQHCLGYSH